MFLAHDDDLDRPVALKFPRLDRIVSHANLEDYIAEARSAARLKHPGIVSVYDVNTETEEDNLFIVLEYVEGRDLAEVLRCERLAPVRAVYVEATGQGTEARLIRGLRRVCRGLPEEDSLVGLILALREGQLLPRGEKVVLLLDQFEQWLHAWKDYPQTELVRALRHCAGQSVQCLLLVRDGFGMSAMRFMNAVEVPVIEGQNYATVDRFDLEHARKVLAHFGRAFGRLPEDGSLTSEQERFLKQAVEGLSEDGQVAPVRLALFADMVRAKPWDSASLRRVGGAEGIGVAFLEETLGASATNPTYRVHQRAARRVLSALLPEHCTNIRGHMLSRRELLEVSG
ncbi:MAG: protein kinase, partial [Planctomycetota bacterium]